MRHSGILWVVIGMLLLLDFYVFQALKVVLPVSSPKLRVSVIIAYWIVSAATILLLFLLPYTNNFETWPKVLRTYLFSFVVGIFFAKLLASAFFVLDDVRRGGTWVVQKLFSPSASAAIKSGEGITRSAFLSWVGLSLGGGLFATLVYGFANKYRYQVNRVKLAFDNLPAAFKGLKIVHISDIHSGSFTDKEAVEKGVHKILKEQPDMVLFTGDLVNDRAVEMEGYMDVFNQVKAPMGVYSTLGNHDYGDYVQWDSTAAKQANLEQLKQVHHQLGWRLLMNEHVELEKDGEKIALLGIENWSAKGNFPKYGKMEDAHTGTEHYPFKILMSHDPSHWEAEILEKYPDVNLVLSGHTHGMQFGVELPGFKWSPVQYMYKQWAGLYERGNQKLYINRGYGFLAYPGRVGILPEITVIELA